MKGLYEFSNPYDHLSANHLSGTILDVGCGDLSAQLNSEHRERFLEAIVNDQYVGVDLPDDIRTWEPDKTFDTILSVQMIAYLPIEDWAGLFHRLKSWLKPDGIIIVIEAYRKSQADTLNIHHKTFDIDETLLSKYLPDMTFFTFTGQPPFVRRFPLRSHLRDLVFGNRRLFRMFLRGSIAFCGIWNNGGKEVSTD